MGVAKKLEDLARQFQKRAGSFKAGSPRDHIAAEVALLSERVDNLHETFKSTARLLTREECAIRNDLSSKVTSHPLVFTYSEATRQRLKQQLFELKRERRRAARDLDAQSALLHDRLFELIRQHASLGGA